MSCAFRSPEPGDSSSSAGGGSASSSAVVLLGALACLRLPRSAQAEVPEDVEDAPAGVV